MTRHRIEQFFATLARELDRPARVFLTGAAAAAMWGRVRPSLDIDFGIEARRPSPKAWAAIEAAVERTVRRMGIAASAAADIDRWGMITLLDYRRTSRLHRRFGTLELRLLDPVTWSIGKLTRYLDPDVRDVVEVFRRQEILPLRAAATWGRALHASPPSTAQFQFRQHVEDFLRREGRRIWGAKFDEAATRRAFYRSARITAASPESG